MPPLPRALWVPRLSRHVSSNASTFREGDRALLRNVKQADQIILTSPLKPGFRQESRNGSIMHSTILEAHVRDTIESHKGSKYRVTWPTLEQYIVKVPRLVTPIYPLDAATIVSLLDIHVDADAFPPLEILEAGTGHGSLTLALARAVHAGNSHLLSTSPPSRRGAIIHSLDNRATHTELARKNVLGFRRGMYSKNVDFHTTDPTTWIKSQLEERGNPKNGFLYATILDMASPGDHLAAVGDALIADGIVGIFCPSITQIGECVKTVKTMRLPLVLETSVEFPGGSGGGAGLRAWDVRYARLRSKTEGLSVREAENRDTGEGKGEEVSDDEFGLVCRPNTFERVIGGGFFAMFRRRSRRSEAKLIQLKIERDAAAAAAALEPSEAQHSPVGLSSAEDIAEERIEEEGAADKNGVPM